MLTLCDDVFLLMWNKTLLGVYSTRIKANESLRRHLKHAPGRLSKRFTRGFKVVTVPLNCVPHSIEEWRRFVTKESGG